jgi:hypothetical protein
MIDFTNKVVSEEVILRHLVLTACQKAKRGMDPLDCARRASDEIVMGILVPYLRETERAVLAGTGGSHE